MIAVFFHVLAVFVAFALTTGVGIFLIQIVRSGDVRAIRVAARAASMLQPGGGILLLVGVALGFYAESALGYSESAGWLVTSQVAVLLILLDGFLVRMPWVGRIAKAAQASPDDRPSDELQRLMTSKLEMATAPISGLLWLIIIVMMTMKPF